MRLIDVDKIYQMLENKSSYGYVSALDISSIEIVEAIPIEWMQQMIEEDNTSGHIDEYGEYQEGTTLGESCEHVLANWYNTYKWKWEKENE